MEVFTESLGIQNRGKLIYVQGTGRTEHKGRNLQKELSKNPPKLHELRSSTQRGHSPRSQSPPLIGHVPRVGVPPSDLSYAIEDRQDQNVHTGIVHQTSVELIQGFATAEPVLPDVVVDPRSHILANGETAREDYGRVSTLCEHGMHDIAVRKVTHRYRRE